MLAWIVLYLVIGILFSAIVTARNRDLDDEERTALAVFWPFVLTIKALAVVVEGVSNFPAWLERVIRGEDG